MRIALVTSYYCNKFPQNEYYLAKELRDRGHEVTIYTTRLYPPWVEAGECMEDSNLSGVVVKRFHSVGSRGTVWRWIRGLRKALKRDNLDVIHFQEWFMPSVLATIGFKNVLVTARKPDDNLRYRILRQTLAPLVCHVISRGVTAVSADARRLVGVSARVIPNGVDTEYFKPTRGGGGNTFTILTVSRLAPEKHLQDLLRACKMLDFNYKVVIVGEGVMRDPLEAQAIKYGIRERVEFLGFVPHYNLAKIYSSADVFVNCSEREPFGNSVAEALSCGTPVIASDVPGGLRDLVSKDVGRLVPPRDPDKLWEAINFVKNHVYHRSSVRSRILKLFSWDIIGEMYEGIYERVAR